MRDSSCLSIAAVCVLVWLTCQPSRADNLDCDQIDLAFATTPAPPTASQKLREFEKQKAAMTSSAEVVLLGDSLTHRWPPATARETFHAARIVNLGIEGDRTQNLLWRLQRYPLENVSPRVATLLIGTNNLSNGDSVCQIIAGANVIAKTLRQNWPSTQLIILGLLKRGGPGYPREQDRTAINLAYRALAADLKATYIDTDAVLECSSNSDCPLYLPDHLHLNPATYEIIGRVIEDAAK